MRDDTVMVEQVAEVVGGVEDDVQWISWGRKNGKQSSELELPVQIRQKKQCVPQKRDSLEKQNDAPRRSRRGDYAFSYLLVLEEVTGARVDIKGDGELRDL